MYPHTFEMASSSARKGHLNNWHRETPQGLLLVYNTLIHNKPMTDLTNLSYKQLQQLEKQIEQRKETLRKSKDCVEGYKITFCVKFNPALHPYTDLRNTEMFGHYLANDVANLIINDFGRSQLDVSGFEVEEMTDEDKEEWKVFWENDDE